MGIQSGDFFFYGGRLNRIVTHLRRHIQLSERVVCNLLPGHHAIPGASVIAEYYAAQRQPVPGRRRRFPGMLHDQHPVWGQQAFRQFVADAAGIHPIGRVQKHHGKPFPAAFQVGQIVPRRFDKAVQVQGIMQIRHRRKPPDRGRHQSETDGQRTVGIAPRFRRLTPFGRVMIKEPDAEQNRSVPGVT